MTRFIKLIECKGKAIILNTARIEHIQMGTKGNDTYIKMLANDQTKENYFFVTETVEDIWLAMVCAEISVIKNDK